MTPSMELSLEAAPRSPNGALWRRVAQVGVGILGTAVALEHVVPHIRWPAISTYVEGDVITPDGLYDVESRVLVAAGLGRKNAHQPDKSNPKSTAIINDIVDRHPGQALDSLVYGDWGVSERRLGMALAKHYAHYYPKGGGPENSRQDLSAHSMGLATTFMAIRWCVKNGIAVPAIGRIETNGSPLSINNTKMRALAERVAPLPIIGGFISKFGVEMRMPPEEDAPSKGRLRTAGRKTLRGHSPMLWASMVRLLIDARESLAEDNIFEGIIDEKTNFDCYISSNDAHVLVNSAMRDIKQTLVDPYGAYLNVHHLGAAGHANMQSLLNHHCNWVPVKNPADIFDGIGDYAANECLQLTDSNGDRWPHGRSDVDRFDIRPLD